MRIVHSRPRRRIPAVLAAFVLLAAFLAVVTVPAGAVGPDAVRPGFDSFVLAANDDGSTSLVPIGFPIDYFGTTYDDLYVNNNGNVTFDSALSTFTPFDLNSTNRVIIAPFFGDVDTRNAGEPVRYGPGLVDGKAAFGVNWVDVDCYFSDPGRAARNSFQLVIVDRSDVASGDFDIEFNYDQIQWETGEASDGSPDCLGGSSARVGFSNGVSTSFELPGSGVPGALLDSNPISGLIHNSLGTAQLGRYVFEVRGGAPPTGGTISGLVFTNPGVSGAFVQACNDLGFCRSTQSDPSGFYALFGLEAGEYVMRAFPPAGSTLNPGTAGPVTLGAGGNLTDVDIELTGPTPPPPGTTIEPSTIGPSGLPSVYWNDVQTLTTTGCAGGVATYNIVTETGGVFSGSMAEGPPGTYTAAVGPFSPHHGSTQVTIVIDCPDPGPDETIAFDIYIDPSGVVETTTGQPIFGATVTLYRSGTGLPGTFSVVPNGSAIMSPSNRTNPDLTDAGGMFRWDVIAGFYLVRAEAEGCVSPSDPEQPFVETGALEIPPPALDLVLVLACGPTEVEIDVKPGSDINPVNTRSRGKTPVAILTTDEFDATTVDPLSVRFGPAEAGEAHRRGHYRDVDGDGDVDLVLHFKTRRTGIQPGDTEACLTGTTFGGEDIAGCDVVAAR